MAGDTKASQEKKEEEEKEASNCGDGAEHHTALVPPGSSPHTVMPPDACERCRIEPSDFVGECVDARFVRRLRVNADESIRACDEMPCVWM